MRLNIVLGAVLSLVFAVAALAASPINGTDRANAARACSSLRTSLTVSTFTHQYATFGACTSQWVHTAHAARVAALAACRAKGLSGTQLSACVKTQTRTRLTIDVSLAKNAAKACAALLHTKGVATFESIYGGNHNLRNAFGKCVSSHIQAASANNGSSTNGNSAAKHYTVTLSQLNSSGVSGTGTLLLNRNDLTVKLDVLGLEAGQTHAVTIRGLASGNATCPTASADANSDGLISLSEGQVYFGSELLALSASMLGHAQTVSSAVLPLQTRTIVVFGKTVNGSYDATLPVACGVVVTL